MGCPGPAVKTASTSTFPRFGMSVQVMVNARGGTTGDMSLENCFERPESVWNRISKVAGVSMPRSNFIIRLEFENFALNPKPQAGARAMLLPSVSANHKLPSGPAVMPHG